MGFAVSPKGIEITCESRSGHAAKVVVSYAKEGNPAGTISLPPIAPASQTGRPGQAPQA
jgi:hypothetical protein